MAGWDRVAAGFAQTKLTSSDFAVKKDTRGGVGGVHSKEEAFLLLTQQSGFNSQNSQEFFS